MLRVETVDQVGEFLGTKVRRLMQEVTGEQKVLVCGVGSWVVVVQDWLN
jgi:hypothetical protein